MSDKPWCGITDIAARSRVQLADGHLIERALRNLRPAAGKPLWSAARSIVFAVGSTYAADLCRAYGLDPDATTDGGGR